MTPESQPDYLFVAINPGGQSVLIEFRPYDEAAKLYFQKVWQRLAQGVQSYHQLLLKAQSPGWASWRPWDWCEQTRGYEQRQKHIGWCGQHMVGFLNVWPHYPSVHKPGKHVLYVEHLAVVPGSLVTELWMRRYSYVGLALVAYAIWLSRQQGFEGRIGLHAADDESLGFYRHLDKSRCQGKLWCSEQSGVLGPTPHSTPEGDGSKVYLESNEEGSLAWLEGYRRG